MSIKHVYTRLYSIFYGGHLHCLKAFHNATYRTAKVIEKKPVENGVGSIWFVRLGDSCKALRDEFREQSCQYTFYVMFRGLVTHFRASVLVFNMLVQTRWHLL